MVNVSDTLPIVFVAHPRTIKALRSYTLLESLKARPNICLLDPQPHIQFMNPVTGAKAVITDSGGLQEETTYLGIPCLTLRPNKERPVTVEIGTNRLETPESLRTALARVQDGRWPAGETPPLWDGRSAQEAVDRLQRRAASSQGNAPA